MTRLNGKHILLGVCGGIAAYKACDWTRALRREGAGVTVVMTRAATEFVTPLTLAALSGNRVHGPMFAAEGAEEIPHISLARQCDCILIAPATARTIARLAHGLADDLLSTVVLAASGRVVVCPAMNSRMFLHPATQANLARLKEYGYTVIEPACGTMACGEEGPGRLPEWEEVRQNLLSVLATQDLAGLKVLITAGPTWEMLDPVRMLTNRATGKMGYALAVMARRRGAKVTLISGPTELPAPCGVELISVRSAVEMRDAVMKCMKKATVIIKAAAVADYRPASLSASKIKKKEGPLTLNLERNPDIIAEAGRMKGKRVLVGFAMETENLVENAKNKLKNKNMDLIVGNDLSSPDAGFRADTNIVKIIDRRGRVESLPLLDKREVAERILDRIKTLRKTR
jgi:phosphopantothenoylcysteine decarboxylase/phosphopantothenate--cysteine ligase